MGMIDAAEEKFNVYYDSQADLPQPGSFKDCFLKQFTANPDARPRFESFVAALYGMLGLLPQSSQEILFDNFNASQEELVNSLKGAFYVPVLPFAISLRYAPWSPEDFNKLLNKVSGNTLRFLFITLDHDKRKQLVTYYKDQIEHALTF